MLLRRRIMRRCKGSQRLQKALAIVMYLKHVCGRDEVRYYTINKIHELTGIAATTLKKYLPIIIQEGWAHLQGSKRQHLVLAKLHSRCRQRNISVDEFSFKSVKAIFCSIRGFLMLMIQAQKDFLRRTLLLLDEPHNYEEYKTARRCVKSLVKKGILDSLHQKYRELGLSIKRIAKEVGCCMRTAQRVVDFVIGKKWAKKQKHQESVYAKNANYDNIEGYTFSTKNNLYIIYANTYTLSKSIQQSLSTPPCTGNN